VWSNLVWSKSFQVFQWVIVIVRGRGLSGRRVFVAAVGAAFSGTDVGRGVMGFFAINFRADQIRAW